MQTKIVIISLLFFFLFSCSELKEVTSGDERIKTELGDNPVIDRNALMIIIKYKFDPLNIQDELESKFLKAGFSIKSELPEFDRLKYLKEVQSVLKAKAQYALIYKYYSDRNLFNQVILEDFYVHIYNLESEKLICKITYTGSREKDEAIDKVISQISKLSN